MNTLHVVVDTGNRGNSTIVNGYRDEKIKQLPQNRDLDSRCLIRHSSSYALHFILECVHLDKAVIQKRGMSEPRSAVFHVNG